MSEISNDKSYVYPNPVQEGRIFKYILLKFSFVEVPSCWQPVKKLVSNKTTIPIINRYFFICKSPPF